MPRQRSISPKLRADATSKRVLSSEVTWRLPGSLRPYQNNARHHPERQLKALEKAIKEQGFTNPILTDEGGMILAGHGRLEAAKRLSLDKVPTLTLSGLTATEKRALCVSDNRIAELAVWNIDALRGELSALVEIDFDVEVTGYSTGEIDIILDGTPVKPRVEPDDVIQPSDFNEAAVTAIGDVWQLGRHRLICADALQSSSYEQLMSGDRAEIIVTDAPYNVSIVNHARGRGATHQREFAMASGEMSDPQFVQFLSDVIRLLIQYSTNGSIHYLFMDWRHLDQLSTAARARYSEAKNLLVWVKTNAGMGTFYRSRHELIAVYKNGTAPHINNFGLGDGGRYRTNVLEYPGVNGLVAKSLEEMSAHPTVKPVALVADLLRDCSRRNGVVLDPFAGSGTILLAAERTSRVARAIEIDPVYVDLGIRRWERATGQKARDAAGRTFSDVATMRKSSPPAKPPKRR